MRNWADVVVLLSPALLGAVEECRKPQAAVQGDLSLTLLPPASAESCSSGNSPGKAGLHFEHCVRSRRGFGAQEWGHPEQEKAGKVAHSR